MILMTAISTKRALRMSPQRIRLDALKWGDELGIALDHRDTDSLVTGDSIEEYVVL